MSCHWFMVVMTIDVLMNFVMLKKEISRKIGILRRGTLYVGLMIQNFCEPYQGDKPQ